jgi:hypothetical protein
LQALWSCNLFYWSKFINNSIILRIEKNIIKNVAKAGYHSNPTPRPEGQGNTEAGNQG